MIFDPETGAMILTPTQLALAATIGEAFADMLANNKEVQLAGRQDQLVACILALSHLLPALCEDAGVSVTESMGAAYWTLGAGKMASRAVH
jgi:hypothetical protein